MFLVVVYPMLDHLDHLVGLGRRPGMLRGIVSGAMLAPMMLVMLMMLVVLLIVLMLMMVMGVSVAILMIMVMAVAHCLDPPWLRLTQ